jgi:biofilm protein TabA
MVMIVTDLKHITTQCPMTNDMAKAVDFLRLRGIHELPDETVEIDGKRVFAIVQRYETIRIDVPRFEYHQKYIDIQYIVSGEEVIGWTPAEHIMVLEAYDGDKDICFGAATGEWTPAHLQAGQMAVLYPEDGHAPRLAAGSSSRVMKIVVKVAV